MEKFWLLKDSPGWLHYKPGEWHLRPDPGRIQTEYGQGNAREKPQIAQPQHQQNQGCFETGGGPGP